MDKVKPNNIEAEKNILGSIMLDNSTIKVAQEYSIKDAFYLDIHKTIYQAMIDLVEAKSPVDITTLSNYLREIKKLDQVGGSYYLTQLINSVPSSKSIKYYIEIIVNKYKLRELINKLNLLLSYSYQEDIDNIIININNLQALGIQPKKNISHEVKEWILLQTGYISVTNCYNELQVVTKEQKTAVRVAFNRLKKEGIIESTDKAGTFRVVDHELNTIDFMNAKVKTFDIDLPLGLNQLVKIYPKNIIIIAGAANAGKTTFLLNLVKDNMNKHTVNYFSSEMGDAEFKLRLELFEFSHLNEWKFNAYERNSNFSDVIKPNDINIIDFMEVHENHYIIGKWIKDIFDKLDQGVAIIAIQKQKGKDIGVGGNVTLEKPRLYLTIDSGVCKIEKAKSFANPVLNPNGACIQYGILQGSDLFPKSGWKKDDFTILPIEKIVKKGNTLPCSI